MSISAVESGEHAFTVSWGDETTAVFPFIWLRDNDYNELHQQTRERLFDLTSVPPDIRPENYQAGLAELTVHWPNKADPSIYSSDWLLTHRPGVPRADPATIDRDLWANDVLTEIPRVDAATCARDPEILRRALLIAKRLGLVVVDGLQDRVNASEDFGALVGFRRETNFGVHFDVVSKAEPNNLAFTSLALPLHTDLANQESVPGYQILHSYRNDVTGGDSLFADGFRICADFEAEEPEYFQLLKSTPIPWRFHDEHCDIRCRRPIISQNEDGSFYRLVFNAHIADVPDFPADRLREFYSAYQALMVRIRHPKYAIRHRLKAGEMVMFDNFRVLHSRTAFDPASGARHFHGYYLEHNEVDSRIRVLSRNHLMGAGVMPDQRVGR